MASIETAEASLIDASAGNDQTTTEIRTFNEHGCSFFCRVLPLQMSTSFLFSPNYQDYR